ncbi:MAG: universal stress protein [Acidobacteriia bacterium]|nr:universal stress protein [Terriglobia bacterium]
MTNKVLVAIDDTGLSELVVDSLSTKMQPDQTNVLVLQVVEPFIYTAPPQMAPGYQPELEARRKDRKELAKRSVDSAVDVLRKAGFQVTSQVVESEIKEGILNTASEWAADLIVVTSHTRKGVAKFFHRSVAEGIVHKAPCSVLVLKELSGKAAA